MSPAPRHAASAHVARYEELRGHAVPHQILAGRFGLAIVLRQGLAAWVEQWSKMPVPQPALSAEISRPSPLSEDTSAEVIHVLAAMALGHLPELHA